MGQPGRKGINGLDGKNGDKGNKGIKLSFIGIRIWKAGFKIFCVMKV